MVERLDGFYEFANSLFSILQVTIKLIFIKSHFSHVVQLKGFSGSPFLTDQRFKLEPVSESPGGCVEMHSGFLIQ